MRSLAPRVYERAYSLRRLRQQGVLQAVSLIKHGYPHRIGYAEVHLRYSPLLRHHLKGMRPVNSAASPMGCSSR